MPTNNIVLNKTHQTVFVGLSFFYSRAGEINPETVGLAMRPRD